MKKFFLVMAAAMLTASASAQKLLLQQTRHKTIGTSVLMQVLQLRCRSLVTRVS